MRIALVTDSTADLSEKLVSKYDIHVVPLTVLFGDKAYLDGPLMGDVPFYEKLKNSEVLPRTSQPSPADFQELYEKLLKEYDHIISIHISSKLSGTYASAQMASEFVKTDKITVVDSKVTTGMLNLMIQEVADAIQRNESLDCVLKVVDWALEKTRNVFTVDTLYYLQKNGRIGKASALIGGMLNFKPILVVRDGVIHAAEKVRGESRLTSKVMEIIDSWGFDANCKLRVVIAHGDDLNKAKEYEKLFKEKYENVEVSITLCGSVIGCHSGPKVIAIAALPSYEM